MNSTEYYKQKIYLAQIDNNNIVTGKIERWQAHQKAICHRGYTVILIYNQHYLLQERKHPVFNKCFDLSFSSHPIYKDIGLQTDNEAITEGLNREWNISQEELIEPLEKNGQIYYKAKDPNSNFSEHEIDIIYQAKLKHLPKPNLNYCFGYKLIKDIRQLSTINNLTPWATIMLKNNLIK